MQLNKADLSAIIFLKLHFIDITIYQLISIKYYWYAIEILQI